MVDSVNPTGQIQSISPSSKSQKSLDSRKSESTSGSSIDPSSSSVDEIKISDEALTLVQVEEIAKQAAGHISSDASVTLSTDSDRLNALV